MSIKEEQPPDQKSFLSRQHSSSSLEKPKSYHTDQGQAQQAQSIQKQNQRQLPSTHQKVQQQQSIHIAEEDNQFVSMNPAQQSAQKNQSQVASEHDQLGQALHSENQYRPRHHAQEDLEGIQRSPVVQNEHLDPVVQAMKDRWRAMRSIDEIRTKHLTQEEKQIVATNMLRSLEKTDPNVKAIVSQIIDDCIGMDKDRFSDILYFACRKFYLLEWDKNDYPDIWIHLDKARTFNDLLDRLMTEKEDTGTIYHWIKTQCIGRLRHTFRQILFSKGWNFMFLVVLALYQMFKMGLGEEFTLVQMLLGISVGHFVNLVQNSHPRQA